MRIINLKILEFAFIAMDSLKYKMRNKFIQILYKILLVLRNANAVTCTEENHEMYPTHQNSYPIYISGIEYCIINRFIWNSNFTYSNITWYIFSEPTFDYRYFSLMVLYIWMVLYLQNTFYPLNIDIWLIFPLLMDQRSIYLCYLSGVAFNKSANIKKYFLNSIIGIGRIFNMFCYLASALNGIN